MSGRKETVLDLAKFVDKGVQVKLTGGRQVVGTLKGYDQLLNLVLDEAVEHLRDADDPLKTTDQKRSLGLIPMLLALSMSDVPKVYYFWRIRDALHL
ncbi:sm-like protein LSM7 isoform X2 [Solanum lycopersicum]|uniref:sm-like protein LSM7 isoform X2 n=1 Tax=Solanum lycopersicum TaxID=4081 RepID=UPI0002BC839D|nr:sm-like protein LSM7 isoform X2 [Solanum lycopersicum]